MNREEVAAVVPLATLDALLTCTRRLLASPGWDPAGKGVEVIQEATRIAEDATDPARPILLIAAAGQLRALGFDVAARAVTDAIQSIQNLHDGWVPCPTCDGEGRVGGKTGASYDLSTPCPQCCPPGFGSNSARMNIHPAARPGWWLPPTGETWTNTARCMEWRRSEHEGHTWMVKNPTPGVEEGIGRCPGWPEEPSGTRACARYERKANHKPHAWVADDAAYVACTGYPVVVYTETTGPEAPADPLETMVVASVGGPWCRDCGAALDADVSEEEVAYVCRTHGGMWSTDPRVIRIESDVPHRPHQPKGVLLAPIAELEPRRSLFARWARRAHCIKTGAGIFVHGSLGARTFHCPEHGQVGADHFRWTEPEEVDADGNPQPDDYEHQGRWYTHYLNHGGTWQAMEGSPPVAIISEVPCGRARGKQDHGPHSYLWAADGETGEDVVCAGHPGKSMTGDLARALIREASVANDPDAPPDIAAIFAALDDAIARATEARDQMLSKPTDGATS